MLRAPATGDPIGSLVVNPGGPGGSGVGYARAASSIVSADVRERYDVVGFDPRGVGSSDPVVCLTPAEQDRLVGADPTPDDPQELDEVVAVTGAVGEGCRERSEDNYRWVDTVSTARDLDILRAALGDERLTYLGKSYGTLIGSRYAERFPTRVGRMVFDGALPPDLTSADVSRGQAVGFDNALERFVADCLDQQGCPVAGSVEEGVGQIRDFLTGLDADPLPGAGGRQLTEGWAAYAILYYLYFPPGDWAELRRALQVAFAGDGSLLMQNLDRRLGRLPDGSYEDNGQDAFAAVTCLDRPTASVEQIERDAEAWRDVAPTWGPYLAYTDLVCAQWPVAAVGEPSAVAAAGSAPILIVATENDPATPYEWGVRLDEMLDSSALVSVNADGHTAYRRGSDCVDRAVDDYLLTGAVPDRDPRCGY